MKLNIQKHTVGTLAILLATLIWGITFSFIKDAVATITPFNFLFWRFGLAAFLLAILFYNKIRTSLKINKKIFGYGMLLGLFLGGTVIFQTIGLRYTDASTAGFITAFAVVLVALFECLLKKTWPTPYLVAAVTFALLGIGFITLENGIEINKGDLWVLACAFCFAAFIILVGQLGGNRYPVLLTFIQSVTIFLVSGFLSIVSTGIEIPKQTNVWIAILFCSVFASIIAFLLQIHYQQYVSATKVAIIFSFEPVFATIAAAIYLHERITLQFFVGASLIFVGTILAERQSRRKVIPQD